MFNPKKIIVPTDFSEYKDQCSMYAIKQAVEIANQFDAELILLHVVHNQKNKYPLFFLDDEKIEDLEAKIDRHAQKQLDEICEKHIIPSGIVVQTKIRHGISYDEIVQEERESEADLIVISSRGESRLVDFFYGSTTEKVARRATCSVLVVRNKNTNLED